MIYYEVKFDWTIFFMFSQKMMMLSLNEDVNFYKITRNTNISIFHNEILIKNLVKI